MKKNIMLISLMVLLTIFLIIFGNEYYSNFSIHIISIIPLILTILYIIVDKQQAKARNIINEQEKNFRSFFHSINDMLFVMNLDGSIIYINQKVLDKLGFGEGELINRNILEVHFIEDTLEGKRMFEEVLDKTRDHCPLPLLRKDNSKVAVDTRIWHGDWYGEPCVYCVSKDITEEVTALDKFSKIFNNNNSLMVVTSVNDRVFLDVNNAFLNSLGYTREEIIGKKTTDINSYADIEKLQELRDKVIENKVVNDFELNLLRKDGSKLYGLCSSEIIDIGREMIILTIITDYTEQKLSQIALEKSHEQFQLAVRGSNDGIWDWDKENNSLYLSPRWKEMIGYKDDELENDFRVFDERLHPEDKERVLNNLNDYVNGNIDNYEIEFRIRHKDNHYIWILSRGYANRDENRKILRMAGSHTDISEKKKKLEEIEYLSCHDSLTGLYNRTYYEQEMKRLDKKQYLPLSIIMADVNGLKLINDAFGHKKGDELLIKISGILKGICKDTTYTLARIGGDEFVILIPNSNSELVNELIVKFNDSIDNLNMDNILPSISFGWDTRYNMKDKMTDILRNAEDKMYHNKLADSSSMRNKTISIIMKTLYEKNKIEEEHSQRVSKLSREIAIAMGMPEYDVNELELAGLMHDIGKIGIDVNILNKTAMLTEQELYEIRKHSEIGYRILSSVSEFSQIANSVLNHHERWDGCGYPKGIKGEEIPLKSRIISVADAYDAMTSARAYRKALTKEYAINELKKNAGFQFDPDIIRIMIEKVLNKECDI